MDTIPQESIKAIHDTRHYIVERARSARRFIKLTNPPYAISELEIMEIPKEGSEHLSLLKTWSDKGYNVGVLSESGMPGIADPGSIITRYAHEHGIRVKSFAGPSSISMSLAASGLNGQSFAFNGYLPIKEVQLSSELKRLESLIFRYKQTQIFIETPYRNDKLFKMLISKLNNKLMLCVARDITGPEEIIECRSVHEWKKLKDYSIGKFPCIFLIGI